MSGSFDEIEEISVTEIDLVLNCWILADFYKEIEDEMQGFKQVIADLIGQEDIFLNLFEGESAKLKQKIDAYFYEVDGHVLHNTVLVGLTVDVLLEFLIVILAK